MHMRNSTLDVIAPQQRGLSPESRRPARLAELFKIGIGPSSSHTMGPMRAAALFVADLRDDLPAVHRLTATVFGSLAWTGKGHATDKALILGLAGEFPENIDPDVAALRLQAILAERQLPLADGRRIAFIAERDIIFDTVELHERHPNAMAFVAYDATGEILRQAVFYSIGGGFVERETPLAEAVTERPVPFPYENAETLLSFGRQTGLRIDEIVRANECVAASDADVTIAIGRFAEVMHACIDKGLATGGELPGGLKVKRRAKQIYDKLIAAAHLNERSFGDILSYVSAFAVAVNEENAAGGRVVTAPTNGAAGVFPAVLRYYRDFTPGASQQGVERFFLAATAIAGIIKRNASISGAEVGCQGEVGSAAAMAAAGLAAALGGSNEQIENAAEIAIEHHLGMTCDPVGGLVQIPCIERNAFGAVKAINATLLALHGDGSHRVSLDQAIESMRQTGMDMSTKYRETSRGGLAVNVPEC